MTSPSRSSPGRGPAAPKARPCGEATDPGSDRAPRRTATAQRRQEACGRRRRMAGPHRRLPHRLRDPRRRTPGPRRGSWPPTRHLPTSLTCPAIAPRCPIRHHPRPVVACAVLGGEVARPRPELLAQSDAHAVPVPHQRGSRAAMVALTRWRIAARRLWTVTKCRRTCRSARSVSPSPRAPCAPRWPRSGGCPGSCPARTGTAAAGATGRPTRRTGRESNGYGLTGETRIPANRASRAHLEHPCSD